MNPAESAGRPLIALVSNVPLLGEAVTAALAEIAEVHWFPADGGDTVGLLRALKPDGVVVDTDSEAAEAAAYVRDTPWPLVHVRLAERRLRVMRDGRWEDRQVEATPQAIRNELIGAIFGRRADA